MSCLLVLDIVHRPSALRLWKGLWKVGNEILVVCGLRLFLDDDFFIGVAHGENNVLEVLVLEGQIGLDT